MGGHLSVLLMAFRPGFHYYQMILTGILRGVRKDTAEAGA